MSLSSGLDVEYLGMIKDKSLLLKYLKDCHLFVFPSRVEALSMQLLEGISMKCHTIASDITANTDVFSSQELLFFHSDDAENLADKMKLALNDSSLMEEYAEKAYSSLMKNYTWDIIARQYSDLYDKIIKENGRQSTKN